jgi:flagellar biosynthesis component FlhA
MTSAAGTEKGVFTIHPAIAACLLGGVLTLSLYVYTTQNSELREHDQAITRLNEADQNHQANSERTWKAIEGIQNTQGQILSALSDQKGAANETNNRLEGLQKAFDVINDFIRPPSNSTPHR